MTDETNREKHVEIRWIGDEKTEVALLRALDQDNLGEVAPGARVLEPKP